jgi:hypothetical protein
MILFRNNDSTYIAADTLFSGLRKYDTAMQKPVVVKDTSLKQGTPAIDSSAITVKDTLKQAVTVSPDSSLKKLLFPDSLKQTVAIVPDSSGPAALPAADTLKAVIAINDSLPKQPSTSRIDTLKKTTAINIEGSPTDSIRYFLGFHHVRIFNDSLQAVSDSMHYSTEDSTFKLFGNPVFWNDETQVKGDTMHLYTENQKAKRLYVFNNAITINKTKEGLFNQMGGRTINGYFKNGVMDYIRVKGSPAESIFYPQDEDSAYVGMNRSKGDVIDIYIVNKALNRIKMINDVDGTLYPLKQIPADLKLLKNFVWLDERRPKNKLELFE